MLALIICSLLLVHIAQPLPPTKYCNDATDCAYGKCCVTETQVRGKRDTVLQGTCQRLGTGGSRCLVSFPQPLRSGMYYVCPCAKGFRCLPTGLHEMPLGEIECLSCNTFGCHLQDQGICNR